MSTDVEDYVRQGLRRLADGQHPEPFDVSALLDEGHRRRRTRRAVGVTGIVAMAVGVTALAVTVPRPGGADPVGPGPAGPAATSSTWSVPAPVPGELGRVLLPDGPASATLEPAAGLAYVTLLSCRSTDPADRMVVEVRHGGSVVESSEAACDGTPVRNGGGTYYPPGERLALSVSVSAPGEPEAYAVVVPYLDDPVLAEAARATLPDVPVSPTARLQDGTSYAVLVSCLADDHGAALDLQVVAGRSGDGRTLLSDSLRCDGSTSGDGFTYTWPGERWATIRLTAPDGARAFAVLTEGTAPD